MALFSPSESVYITSFLSAVDLDSSINSDGSVNPGVADRVPHLQGREALSKATKDLMSLDVPLSSHYLHATSQPSYSQQSLIGAPSPSYWPSVPGSESGPSLFSSTPKFGTSGIRSSSPANYLARGLSSTAPASHLLRLASQSDHTSSSTSSISTSQAHLQIAPLRGFDPPAPSSEYTLPPMSTTGFPHGPSSQDGASRPPVVVSSASDPSILSSSTVSGKRPLPLSLQPATSPSSSKRSRSSLTSPTPFPPPPSNASAPDAESPLGSSAAASVSKPRRDPTPISTQTLTQGKNSAPPPISVTNSSSGSKGPLLSPSQKRANHIQSEQKRRANIRRGYEALCETVPALREAIHAEEERERARDVSDGYDDVGVTAVSAKGKARAGAGVGAGAGAGVDRGKKRKGKAEREKPDGRAGPRSENVVLQKTIDYIAALSGERSALQQQLKRARGMLPPGHPALPVDPQHLDVNGVPLWERQWNGGMDLDFTGDGGVGGTVEDEGSEEES